jgi:hypothetical protein
VWTLALHSYQGYDTILRSVYRKICNCLLLGVLEPVRAFLAVSSLVLGDDAWGVCGELGTWGVVGLLPVPTGAVTPGTSVPEPGAFGGLDDPPGGSALACLPVGTAAGSVNASAVETVLESK